MKRIEKYAGMFLLVIVMIFSSSCSADSIFNSSSSESKYNVEFYKNNGYYELSVCESLTFALDETCMAEIAGTILVKGGTKIIINHCSNVANVSNTVLDESLSNFNFEERTTLEGYMIGDNFYEIEDFENLEYTISADTTITEKVKSFEIVGFVVYNECEYNEKTQTFLTSEQEYIKSVMLDENGDLSPKVDDYLFYYFGESEEKFENGENITENLSMIKISSVVGLTNIYLEIPTESVTSHIFLTIKDEDGDYYFIKLASSEDELLCTETESNGEKILTFNLSEVCDYLNLFKFNLILCSDLTSTFEYLR